MSHRFFLAAISALALTSAAFAQNAPSPGVGIGIVNAKRGYNVQLGPSDIGSPPVASSGVRTVDWVNAAEAVAPGVTVASNTGIPDYPTGPIWRAYKNPFTEPGSAYVAWVQTTFGLTQQQISAIFTAAGGVMTTPSTGQQVQVQIPTPSQVGAAAIDLTNVNPTQGLAQLGAASITLSNVNPATGRASIGVGAIGQLNTISGVPVGATTLSIGGVTSPNVIPYISIKTLGAVGDGATDDSPAFLAAFNSTADATYFVPPGIYRIPCGVSFTAAAAASFVGASSSKSILKYDAGCTITGDMVAWHEKSGVTFHDLTVDFNNPAIPAAPFKLGLVFYSQAGNVDGLQVYNNRFINGVDRMLMVTVASGNSFTYKNIWEHDNYLEMTPGHLDNQGIAYTQGSGFITDAHVYHNTQVGTGIQFDAAHSFLMNNDTSGYEFGTGTFTVEDANDIFNVISGNVAHDTIAGVDSNGTAAGGMENGASFSTVSNNIAFNLGGAGIGNFGNNNILQGNIATNIGINGPADSGILDQAGIALLVDGGTAFVSANTTVVGNKTYDTGSGTTKYGYGEQVGYTGVATLRGNDFTGAVQALVINSPNTSTDAGFSMIAGSPLGAGAAFFQFAPNQGLDTASYHSWHLACHDINPATAETVGIQVGEGVGGSFAWETGAHYAVQAIINSTGTPTAFSSGTLTMAQVGSDAWSNNGGSPASFSVDLGNLNPGAPSSKLMRITGTYFKNGANPGSVTETALWNGDTNAITALRVVTASGDNLTGSCTLTGNP